MIAARQKISPPELAKRWGLDPHKILTWIRAGELRAIDVCTRQGSRPRYAIDEADILAFENRRAVGGPPVKMPRRRKKDMHVIEFF
ncbi:MAG: helix-turn-helix domain-containing protein [Thermoguttaceae bacterium]|jgi:hypothetical protein